MPPRPTCAAAFGGAAKAINKVEDKDAFMNRKPRYRIPGKGRRIS
jgi:hypothetical protein